MITEAETSAAGRDGRRGRVWRAALIAGGVWLAALTLLTVTLEPTQDALVVVASDPPLAILNDTETRIVSGGPGYLIVHGETKGYVRQLYRHGALLVLPAKPSGCIARGVLRS